MGNYVNKFGFYEFLALLVPGTVFSYAVMYLIPYWFVKTELYQGCELSGEIFIVVSIVGSFVVGMILQELGTIWDQILGYKLLYGGNPDKRWIDAGSAGFLQRYRWVVKDCDATKANNSIGQSMQGSADRRFYYMLNTLEANGAHGKAEKMMIASELSRSLALGSAILLLIHIGVGVFRSFVIDGCYWVILTVLVVMIILFTIRKVRYERFRFSTVIRTFVIFKEAEIQKNPQSADGL